MEQPAVRSILEMGFSRERVEEAIRNQFGKSLIDWLTIIPYGILYTCFQIIFKDIVCMMVLKFRGSSWSSNLLILLILKLFKNRVSVTVELSINIIANKLFWITFIFVFLFFNYFKIVICMSMSNGVYVLIFPLSSQVIWFPPSNYWKLYSTKRQLKRIRFSHRDKESLRTTLYPRTLIHPPQLLAPLRNQPENVSYFK